MLEKQYKSWQIKMNRHLYSLTVVLFFSCVITKTKRQQQFQVTLNNTSICLNGKDSIRFLRKDNVVHFNEYFTDSISNKYGCDKSYTYMILGMDIREFFTLCDSILIEYEQIFTCRNSDRFNFSINEQLFSIKSSEMMLDRDTILEYSAVSVFMKKYVVNGNDTVLSVNFIQIP